MSLWKDNRDKAPGPGLHALVIGVSEYRGLPEPALFPPLDDPIQPETLGLTQVKTPATSAWRIAQWLAEKYYNPAAPLKTLRLLLSSSAEELDKIPGLKEVSTPERRATKDHVWQDMLDWKKDCENEPDSVTVFYASGHGVQWGSRDDALVLLEDFPKQEMFLDYAVDVGGTFQSMAGPKLPQTQLYFVDACRVRPEARQYFDSAGKGLQFRITSTGEDLRTAPIYFAAAPETYAQGVKQEGTFFSQALLDALNGLAASNPSLRGEWSVTLLNLHPAVDDRIQELARKHGEKQQAMLGGRITRSPAFHVFKEPPLVPVVVEVDPATQSKILEAELKTEQDRIRGLDLCGDEPLEWPAVPARIYSLVVHRPPPAAPIEMYIPVSPPRWHQPLRLT